MPARARAEPRGQQGAGTGPHGALPGTPRRGGARLPRDGDLLGRRARGLSPAVVGAGPGQGAPLPPGLAPRLVREVLTETADLLLVDGDYHRAWSMIEHLVPLRPGPNTPTGIPRCPHCLAELEERSMGKAARRDLLNVAAAPDSDYRKPPA